MKVDEIATMESAMIADIAVFEGIILAGRLVQARRLHGQWSDEAKAVIHLQTELRRQQADEDRLRRKTSSRIDRSDAIRARTDAARIAAFLAQPPELIPV